MESDNDLHNSWCSGRCVLFKRNENDLFSTRLTASEMDTRYVCMVRVNQCVASEGDLLYIIMIAIGYN